MGNVEKLVAILEKHDHCFYHFTDTRNLPSIREHGLLSMRSIRQNRETPLAPGGNSWSQDADIRSGMDGYVHLCFFSDHPMEWLARQDGRIANSTFLRISPSVLRIPGVLITDGVANKSTVVPKSAEDMIAKLDLKVIYTRTDWKDSAIQERLKAAKLCEILVPAAVALPLIKSIPNG
jgi:ssDNA thymidine ADP-ribosyltransferase, DarT